MKQDRTVNGMTLAQYESLIEEYRTETPKIPEMYGNPSLDDYSDTIADSVEKMLNHTDKTKTGFYIHGAPGVGKSHLMYAIMNRVQERRIAKMIRSKGTQDRMWPPTAPWFFNASELFSIVRENMDVPIETRRDVVGEIMELKPMLFLDDIGSEHSTPWATSTMYRIVNNRWENKLPTFYSSNLDPDGMRKVLGDRTASRILGSSQILNLGELDQRIK